jgi:hypothetical protein
MSARSDRSNLQVKVFPLGGEPGEDLSATTTPSERLAMVAALSEEAWVLTGIPMPHYLRQQIPIRKVPLASKTR